MNEEASVYQDTLEAKQTILRDFCKSEFFRCFWHTSVTERAEKRKREAESFYRNTRYPLDREDESVDFGDGDRSEEIPKDSSSKEGDSN